MSEERGPLERGLAVMRLLNQHPGQSLEQLVRRTCYPKTSLFRILQILVDEQIVERDYQGCYHPLMRLTPLVENSFAQRLQACMLQLSTETGQTVEWYLPQPEGMVISSRESSPSGEAVVRARVGFVRFWQEELEAVLCLGLAFLKPEGVVVDLGGLNAYQAPFVLSLLPREQAEARMAAAKAGLVRDDIPNENNVRRVAALVRQEGRPVGVLAIAEVVHPAEPNRIAELEHRLASATAHLNT